MRYCLAFVALGFLVLTGCPTASLTHISTNETQPAPVADETPIEGTLVTLKLPNMVCGGCAAAVEEELKNVTGIDGIKTDFTTNVCKFVVTDDTLDWKTKLADLAKDNSHLEDWSVVEGS
jgi:copper chaperone CopZ